MLGELVLSMFMLQAPTTAPAAPQNPAPAAQSDRQKSALPEGVFRVEDVNTRPRLIKEAKPNYTADAMRARIQGTVILEVIVEKDGSVGDVRVKQSLDREYGLDDEAVKALKRWRFAPGMRNGAAVPVLVEVELTFTLRK